MTSTPTTPAADETAALRTVLVPGSGQVVVRLLGDVDASTSPLVSAALHETEVSNAPLVVVDVGDAHFWDVSGLHVLAAFSTDLTAAGRCCRVVGATAPTRRLVGLADFTSTLRLEAA